MRLRRLWRVIHHCHILSDFRQSKWGERGIIRGLWSISAACRSRLGMAMSIGGLQRSTYLREGYLPSRLQWAGECGKGHGIGIGDSSAAGIVGFRTARERHMLAGVMWLMDID